MRIHVTSQLAHQIPSLHFALRFGNKLGSGSTDGQLASLLHLRLENDLVAVSPHLGHERLARQHGSCEADFDVLVGTEPGQTLATAS